MIDLNFISKIALEYSKAREKNGSVEKGSTANLQLMMNLSRQKIFLQNLRM